ncbi:hypothetical protein I316_01946 [Kwoniella heveanensis BCC8398]|uniref:Uncharacterized protein n=1 Tax=Kwoniella heveanensis BCC8398 TaxID=1296120 RepID=A0A1B9GYF5_9TREE|nr:hypothetical protein I316_01946 [Kwoniella heveanensis BCC8398]
MSVVLAPPIAPPTSAPIDDQPQFSPPLEQTESRASLTHSATSGSTSADDANTDNTTSQLDLNPTISHSTDGAETLVTPIDPPSLTVHIKNSGPGGVTSPIIIQSTIDEEPESQHHSLPSGKTGRPQDQKLISTSAGIETQTPKKGRLNLSKSMQTLRRKKEKGRERASSLSEKDVPAVPPLPATSEQLRATPAPAPAAPAPTSARPTRPPLQTKSSSGAFSSFLRKLTGRSTPSSSPTTAEKPAGLPQQDKEKEKDKSATMAKRKTMSAFGTASKPALSKIDTSSTSTQAKKGPVSAQPNSTISNANQVVASPLPITPVQPPSASAAAKETDPLRIPLPPSPTFESAPLAVVSDKTEDSSAPAPQVQASVPASTVTRKKAEAMLSFEGFDLEEEAEESSPANANTLDSTRDTSSVGAKEHLAEVSDVVRPLAPIQIPPRTISTSVASAAGPSSATSAHTAATGTSVSSTLSSSPDLRLITPTSAVSTTGPQVQTQPQVNRQAKERPENMHEGVKYAGSSPPRKAPIGTGLGDLGRKESKWRKSVMGLADKSVSKRQSVRAPPTSNDAYAARQAQIARNRQSCQPTLHSTASIAAASRGQMGKMSKEEQEVAETFFMA